MIKKKILLFSLAIFTIALVFIFDFKEVNAQSSCSCDWWARNLGTLQATYCDDYEEQYSGQISCSESFNNQTGRTNCHCTATITTPIEDLEPGFEDECNSGSIIKTDFPGPASLDIIDSQINCSYTGAEEKECWCTNECPISCQEGPILGANRNDYYITQERDCSLVQNTLNRTSCEGLVYCCIERGCSCQPSETGGTDCSGTVISGTSDVDALEKAQEWESNCKTPLTVEDDELGTCSCSIGSNVITTSALFSKCEETCITAGGTMVSWESGLPGPKETGQEESPISAFGPLVPVPTGTCPENYTCDKTTGICLKNGQRTQIECNYSMCDFIQVGVNITRIIFGMMGGIALILFVWGGGGLITAAGNPEKIQESKKLITGTIFGIIIILLAWSLINFGITLITTGDLSNLTGDPALIFGKPWNICQ